MTAVLLAAHGSRDPWSVRTVATLASAVRARLAGDVVLAAFLDHGRPDVPTALGELAGPAVVVPLLLAEGYHSTVDLPALVAASPHPVELARVLGPDELVVEALERRLREAGVWPGEAGVVLATAGSSGPHAALAAGWTAGRLTDRGWGAVRTGYVSAAAPTVPDAVTGLRREGHRTVVVASGLLAPGRFHSALAAAGGDLVTAPLGGTPELAELVCRRVQEVRALAPA